MGRLWREVLELRRRMPRIQVRTPAGGGGKGTPLHLIRIDSVSGGEYGYTAMKTSDGQTFTERSETGKAYERNGWTAMWGDGSGGDRTFIVGATKHGSGEEAFMMFDMPMPPITSAYQGVFLSEDGKLAADHVRMH